MLSAPVPRVSATQHRVAAARGPGRPARVELDSAGRSGRAGLGLLWGVRDVPPADPMSAPPFRLSLPGGQPGAEGPFVGTAHPVSKRPDGRVTRAARWQRLCGCSGDAEPGLGDCGGRGMVTGHWTVNQTHRWAWEGQRCPPARRGAGQRPWGASPVCEGGFRLSSTQLFPSPVPAGGCAATSGTRRDPGAVAAAPSAASSPSVPSRTHLPVGTHASDPDCLHGRSLFLG